jgi:hypothetical protein
MAPTPVAPGDVITADQFNSIVSALGALDARLKLVEQRPDEPGPKDPKWKHILDNYLTAIQENKADRVKLKDIATEMVNRGVPSTVVVKAFDDKGVAAVDILEVVKTLPDPPDLQLPDIGRVIPGHGGFAGGMIG